MKLLTNLLEKLTYQLKNAKELYWKRLEFGMNVVVLLIVFLLIYYLKFSFWLKGQRILRCDTELLESILQLQRLEMLGFLDRNNLSTQNFIKFIFFILYEMKKKRIKMKSVAIWNNYLSYFSPWLFSSIASYKLTSLNPKIKFEKQLS